MAKKCPPGKYYCFTDKKCKKIPRGYHIGARGYLARGDNRSDSDGDDGSGNGSSNGNGNGGNGSGNGNGGSGGNGGGNGGGGMGESIIYEKSNPRIPRKAGQPAKSKKHSDLYTDEDPKGTIHGLGFKNVAKARASVSKIRNSSRSHAHKIQAAVAMEQRAREMGKTSEAAVYRKYINAMKKKTKRMNEAVSAAQQAAIAIDMKKKGKKPKSMNEKVNPELVALGVEKVSGVKNKLKELISAPGKALLSNRAIKKNKKTKLVSADVKEGMYNHTDVGLITNAVVELEDGLKTLKTITYDSVDQLMQGIAKRNDISPTLLHNQFKAKHLTIPDNWAIRYRMNKMKGIEEATMTSAQKRKDTMLKKKYDKSDMKKSMQKQYGKEEGKKVYFATIRKQAMKEESQEEMEKRVRKAQTKIQNKEIGLKSDKPIEKPKLKNPEGQFSTESLDDKYNVSEEGLRDWFGKSSGTTKSGRKVRGWVQVGGKYDGKPCARQPGQKSTPKCVSSSKRRSMSKSERDSAARRKRAADPNQPQKSGAAKPTNVSTDPKRKMKENYFREGIEDIIARLEKKRISKGGNPDESPLGKKVGRKMKELDDKQKKNVNEKKMVKVKLNPEKKIGVKVTDIGPGGKEVVRKNTMNEAKDKKGKGSGTKDACYHKVKSRYSVWPSAYASGALVKCRKVGAANWGNKSKNEGFSPMQVAALEAAGMIEIKEGKKCWKGYKKAGTQKLFGKTYNRCVKAGDELNHDGEQLQEMNPSFDIKQTKTQKLQNMAKTKGPEGKIAQDKLDKKKANEPKLPTVESYAKITEGVMALMKKKEEKKKSKPSVSTYVSKSKSDAGNRAAKIMRDKEQQKYVGFLPANEEKDLTNESKTRLVKNGHTYKVVLTWRGKTYMVQMFVPSVSRPTRKEIEKEVQKLYPDAKVMSFLPKDLEPGEPTVMMGEGKNLEFMKQYKQKENEEKQKAKVKKNLETYEGDEQHTTTTSEEYVAEDDMKGMSVKSGHKRPTKSGAGMTAKGVAAYRRRNPGSKLQTAVTGKVKKGSKDAKRRKSYCARSAGQMKKFPKAAKDPNSRLRQARRRWKC